MNEMNAYLNAEETAIKAEIEYILRQMCFGRFYREWSETMLDKLYKHIYDIMLVDLVGQQGQLDRLVVDEDMVITAMMMCINQHNEEE